jgi:hypothetical protein
VRKAIFLKIILPAQFFWRLPRWYKPRNLPARQARAGHALARPPQLDSGGGLGERLSCRRDQIEVGLPAHGNLKFVETVRGKGPLIACAIFAGHCQQGSVFDRDESHAH